MNDLRVARTSKWCGCLVLDPKLSARTWLAVGGVTLPSHVLDGRESLVSRCETKRFASDPLSFEIIGDAESAISRFLLFSML
jgi:hypothetical protein